jgi:hypothetical protein
MHQKFDEVLQQLAERVEYIEKGSRHEKALHECKKLRAARINVNTSQANTSVDIILNELMISGKAIWDHYNRTREVMTDQLHMCDSVFKKFCTELVLARNVPIHLERLRDAVRVFFPVQGAPKGLHQFIRENSPKRIPKSLGSFIMKNKSNKLSNFLQENGFPSNPFTKLQFGEASHWPTTLRLREEELHAMAATFYADDAQYIQTIRWEDNHATLFHDALEDTNLAPSCPYCEGRKRLAITDESEDEWTDVSSSDEELEEEVFLPQQEFCVMPIHKTGEDMRLPTSYRMILVQNNNSILKKIEMKDFEEPEEEYYSAEELWGEED